MFKIRNSGFRITFGNGWSVSVQFSPMHYCSNKDRDVDVDPMSTSATTAEVAVIDPDGFFHRFDHKDDVLGWQSPDEVAAVIARVVAYSGDRLAK